MTKLVREGTLRAVHLTAAGDFAPQRKGSLFRPLLGGAVHGVTQRLVLNPRDAARPVYYVAAGEDDDCVDLAALPFDQFGHNLYAKDLCGMSTPKRPHTIPLDVEWPLPSSV